MRANPRGAITRTFRLVERDTDADGVEVTRTISGAGIIVKLAYVDGRKPSDVRRDFARYCQANAIIATPCEYGEGQFSTRTGRPIPGSEPAPSAYQCIGSPEALNALTNYFTVGEWTFALNVQPPRMAQGSGPEKVRPSMGSAFGRPEQVQATATALARDRTNAIRATNTNEKR